MYHFTSKITAEIIKKLCKSAIVYFRFTSLRNKENPLGTT